ncbi:hypothetical protein LCGC14_0748960 [marine sediment metagenome]|uniref:PIN domain-containing protein n=1 Tax=marine sediment metagenome TaxID=412755 RepID=A0A0F9Q4I8_9ZZZZ
MKYLYLDQNIWIYLCQIYYGKREDQIYNQVLEKITTLTQKKKLIVPINLSNVVEIHKITNKKRKEKLAKFMVKVSQGYSFIPYPYIIDLEIIHHIKNYIKIPICSIQESAIGIGDFYLIHDGTAPKLKSKFPISEEKKEMYENVMKNKFSTQKAILKFILDDKRPKSDFKSTVREMTRISNLNLKYKDKKSRQKMRMVKFLIMTFFPRLIHWCKEYNVDTKEIVKNLSTLKEIIDFLKQFPLLYTNICLHNGIEKIPNRPYNVNDIPDIASFCFAIPYCDFVIGERFLISIARRKNLHLLYSTKLYTNKDRTKLLSDLNNID